LKTQLSAIILTGGTSSRFGSDKSQARIGAISLIENLLITLPSEIDIVIVGPELANNSRPVKYTKEDPLGGGPVAAIEAGLDLINSEFVFIVATDMPFASQILPVLTAHLPDTDGVTIPLDSSGMRQPLCAIYRKDALAVALRELGGTQGQSLRNLVQRMSVKELQLEPALRRILLDVDTPADLERAISLGEVPEK
jgi:molybdopterin-guanine dinucleotide biosynthesis protein A